jgi:hypothetical protein
VMWRVMVVIIEHGTRRYSAVLGGTRRYRRDQGRRDRCRRDRDRWRRPRVTRRLPQPASAASPREGLSGGPEGGGATGRAAPREGEPPLREETSSHLGEETSSHLGGDNMSPETI